MTDNPYQSPSTEPERDSREPLGWLARVAAGLWFLAGAGATMLTVFPLTGEPGRWGGVGFWFGAGYAGMTVGTLLAIMSLARSRARAQRLASLRQDRMNAIEQLRGPWGSNGLKHQRGQP